jgi:hypothetical protein
MFRNENLYFNLNSTDFNYSNDFNALLGNKIKNNNIKKSEKRHTKFSSDNLKRVCKHLVLENVMDFINKKIFEVYDGNIGKGLTIKKLMKLNQEQKKNADVEFNKIFIKKTLKEIFSQNITKQIKLYEAEHNKNLINELISEKADDFKNLFNLTFIECVEHFIGDKQIEELKGLPLFSEIKDKIIKKHEKDGESFYENIYIFLKGFENRINKAKSRRKKKIIKTEGN